MDGKEEREYDNKKENLVLNDLAQTSNLLTSHPVFWLGWGAFAEPLG